MAKGSTNLLEREKKQTKQMKEKRKIFGVGSSKSILRVTIQQQSPHGYGGSLGPTAQFNHICSAANWGGKIRSGQNLELGLAFDRVPKLGILSTTLHDGGREKRRCVLCLGKAGRELTTKIEKRKGSYNSRKAPAASGLLPGRPCGVSVSVAEFRF